MKYNLKKKGFKISFLVLTIFSFNLSFSQTTVVSLISDSINKNSHTLRVAILLPGIIYEYGVSKNNSIRAEMGIGGIIGGKLVPHAQSEFRYYYNISRRAANGHPVKNFSGSFLSIMTGYQFLSDGWQINRLETLEDALYIGPTWGIQWNRNILHFDFNIGYAYGILMESKTSYSSIIIDLSLGFKIWGT
jgi:hypothetical protein